MSGSGVVGGDLATLASLKRTFEQSQEEARQLAATIDASLRSTVWTGANADRFQQVWEEFRPTLESKLPEELSKAELDIKNQHNALADAMGEGVGI